MGLGPVGGPLTEAVAVARSATVKFLAPYVPVSAGIP